MGTSTVIGWIAWSVVAFLALSFAYVCRKYASQGLGFQWATGVQTLFLWVIAFVFLLSPVNKLHILWVTPIAWLLSQFIALSGIPILSPLVLLVTRVFLDIVCFPYRRQRQDDFGRPI